MQIFTNVTFISCEDSNRIFSSLIEDGGKIVFTGDSIPEKYIKAPRIDLAGRSVLPAFADTHLHFLSYTLFNSTFDVRNAENFDDIVAIISQYDKANPDKKFLIGFGVS